MTTTRSSHAKATQRTKKSPLAARSEARRPVPDREPTADRDERSSDRDFGNADRSDRKKMGLR